MEKTLSAKNQTKPSHPKLKSGPHGILLYIEEAGAKGLLPLSPAPQIPAEPASASLRTIVLDDSEHFLHNHHASVATLRLLFTFVPESRSASLRNRCSPSPEYPSGIWKAFKASRSLNGSLIKYTCTKDSFSAETPLGERYTAKFDGQFYPVEDDPGHAMVSAKLLDARTVELTSKRNRKIVSVSRLSVAPDGNSIHAVFENKESGSKTAFDFEKQK